MTSLRMLGYWRNAAHPEYPDPADLVDEGWDEDEKNAVSWFLCSGLIARAYMGYSPCRICGNNNGAVDYTDGVYMWPEGLHHYVDEHAVRLPQELVEHAVRWVLKHENFEQEDGWWLNSARSVPS